MTTKPQIVSAEPVAKREIKKLTIKITDPAAVLAKYPGVKLVITKETVDRKKLRPIVKALFEVGVQVDGVTAYYADPVEAAPALESTHNQLSA